ncbi:MAG TPA: hypothetical protein VFE72_07495 [Lysobacter sp.]|nr:hypothetical protein [Lysobacter sp.]
MSVFTLLQLAMFIAGCVLAIYGVVVTIAMLDKPRGWYCHLRGLSLIGLFVMSAVGLCAVLFMGMRPELPSAIYTLLTGMLVVLYGRQLRINAARLRSLRGRATLAAREGA